MVVYREPPAVLKKYPTDFESAPPEGMPTSGQRAAHQSEATSSRWRRASRWATSIA